MTDRFVLDQLDVTGEETVTCEAVPFYLLTRFRDLSFLSEAERKAFRSVKCKLYIVCLVMSLVRTLRS